MSEYRIVFSTRAKERLKQIAADLHQQQLSNAFVSSYLRQFEDWLDKVLLQFPESGTPLPEHGEGIRRIVYQKYSFIYRIQNSTIEILAIHRENKP